MRVVFHIHLQPIPPDRRGGVLIRQIGGLELQGLDFYTGQLCTGDAECRLLLRLFAIADDPSSRTTKEQAGFEIPAD